MSKLTIVDCDEKANRGVELADVVIGAQSTVVDEATTRDALIVGVRKSS
jgi:hypothetical protein